MKEIIIVYEGKSPYETAINLRSYIECLGYKTKIIGADIYEKRYGGKVIVVGHHDFAKDMERILTTQYENFGMSYCFSDNQCVLIAHRSGLGSKQTFMKYYNIEMQSYRELAGKYGIPLCFGERDKTRKSQYDLLWLQFVQNGLAEFLGEGRVSDKLRELRNDEPNNLKEEEKDVVVGPLEISVELEINNSCLKCALKLKDIIKIEKIIKKIAKNFLAKEQIPAKVDSLKVQKKTEEVFCVNATCSVSDYTAFFRYILPKLLKKEKKENTMILEAVNIIGLENVSDRKKMLLAVTAIDIFQDMVCHKTTIFLSKFTKRYKFDGIVVRSIKVRA